MNIRKKRHLEIAIENIPKFESPKIHLEQYLTPAPIVAELLWVGNAFGDITNKSILDLGCGTGILTLAPLLLGAKSATGFDIDHSAIKIAKKTAKKMDLHNAHFFVKNIYDIDLESEGFKFEDSEIIDNNDLKFSFDTAITNPPFGSQLKAKKGADRIFMDLAMKLADVVYSFHMGETDDFVKKYYANLGGEVTHKFSYKFPLTHSYDFHSQEKKYIDVFVVRVVKLDNVE